MCLFGYDHSIAKQLIRFGFHPGKGSENVTVEHLSPPGTPAIRHFGAIGWHENSKRYGPLLLSGQRRRGLADHSRAAVKTAPDPMSLERE